MSGASHTLDPVAAARDDIHRSKHLIASTLDDLQQHHRWLEDYHRAERRRMQRLHRRELLYQIELKRRRTMGKLRRITLISLFMARTAATFLIKRGSAFVVATYRLTVQTARWTAPRAVALGLFLEKQLTAGLAWSWATGRYLTRESAKQTVIALTWMVRASDVAGVAFRRRLAVLFAALSARVAILARPMQDGATLVSARLRHWSGERAVAVQARAAETWSWLALETRRMHMNASEASAKTRRWSRRSAYRLRADLSTASAKTGRWSKRSAYRLRAQLAARSAEIAEAAAHVPPALHKSFATTATSIHARSRRLAFAAKAATASGWTWIGTQADHVMAWRSAPAAKPSHALVIRQCTALIIFEPRRARLPVVRAG